MIDIWRICVSGNREAECYDTGISEIWELLHEQYAGPSSAVVLRPWYHDMAGLARMIENKRPKIGKPRVLTYGYSWGAYSTVLLARELQAVGLDVHGMLLIDPVYRAPWCLGWWRSLVPWSRIYLPPNVRGPVYWYRQRNRRFRPFHSGGWIQPAGHEVLSTSKETGLHEPVTLDVTHSFIDEHPDVQLTALSLV